MFCKVIVYIYINLFVNVYRKQESVRIAMDEITKDVFSLDVNDSTSTQNSHNPTVQNVWKVIECYIQYFCFYFCFVFSF